MHAGTEHGTSLIIESGQKETEVSLKSLPTLILRDVSESVNYIVAS